MGLTHGPAPSIRPAAPARAPDQARGARRRGPDRGRAQAPPVDALRWECQCGSYFALRIKGACGRSVCSTRIRVPAWTCRPACGTRPPARWRAPGSASTAEVRHQSAACDGDGGSDGCGRHRPVNRAPSGGGDGGDGGDGDGGGGDCGRRGRRRVKRASAAAAAAAAMTARRHHRAAGPAELTDN